MADITVETLDNYQRRPHRITLQVTDYQWARIQAAAKRIGMSPSALAQATLTAVTDHLHMGHTLQIHDAAGTYLGNLVPL